MARLDDMLLQYGGEQLVTLVYLLADPERDQLLIANAGHPAPVLLRADGSTEQAAEADGAPVGVGAQQREHHAVEFCPGDTVLVFTDGLIERRVEDIDEGQRRLVANLATLADEDLDGGLRHLVDEVRDTTRDDDVAALAIRRHRT